MEEEEIDVVNVTKIDFQCEHCKWIGKSDRSLSAHKRHKHSKPEEQKRNRGRPKRENTEALEEVKAVEQISPQRVTTKQLLGGRKRPKTIVDSVEDSALKTDREAARLHEMGIIDEETSLGDYVRRGQYQIVSSSSPQDEMLDLDGSSIVVGKEVIIDDEIVDGNEDDIPMINRFQKFPPARQRHPQNRRYPEKIPDRLTRGDSNGKYRCYIKECTWRGGYRSLRMDHMKAIHPEWKMPPRFLLQRITKDGVYINPDSYVPPFACSVEGCDWRGNYRASRSSHMRKQHPEEHAEKKKNAPGYNSNGTYSCHYPLCSWRGWSRSTRSVHLKRAHPEWRPDDNRVMMVLQCFYCKSSFHTYPQLADHIITHGGLGLHIDQVFENKSDFSIWLQQMEHLYCITFERSELGNDPEMHDLQNYVLHCNCVGGRGVQLASESRAYIYQKHNFLKRRHPQLLTRHKNDCSVHLEVREETAFGPIHIKGNLEHTGHRFGTPLLRMSPMDRQLYSDVLDWKLQSDFRFYALDAVDKLNAYEGFTMDHYSLPKTLELIEPMDENPFVSLRNFIEHAEPHSFFSVDFSQYMSLGKFSFGYMSPEMQKMWQKFGPQKTVTIDSTLMEFDDVEIIQYSVLVSDSDYVPRCALIYVTTDQPMGPVTILEQMKSVDPRPPNIFMVDPSQVWVDLIQQLWPNHDEISVLISEWTLMDYWAAKTEEVVSNEFDVFSIVTILRRLLRTEDTHQLYFIIVELFEAFYECGYDAMAEFMDAQLSDVEYFKRWGPLLRHNLTTHAHPTIGVSSRILRDLYLNNHGIERIDQWVAHIIKRVYEFNEVPNTQTYTLRPLDPPRKFFYTTSSDGEEEVNQDQDGADLQEIQDQELQDQGQMVVYEDMLAEGEVVEEEIIGHEIVGEEEEIVEEIEEEIIYDDEIVDGYTEETYSEEITRGEYTERHQAYSGRPYHGYSKIQTSENVQDYQDQEYQDQEPEFPNSEQGIDLLRPSSHRRPLDPPPHRRFQEVHIDKQIPTSSESAKSSEKSGSHLPGPSSTASERTVAAEDNVEMVEEKAATTISNVPSPNTIKIPPHRLRLYQHPKSPGPSEETNQRNPPPLRAPSKRVRILTKKVQEQQESLAVHTAPPPTVTAARRETTKTVVRSRKRRDRFAELRDCPPEIMRAIAAQAIAYDGRRKEQKPIMIVPSPAKMASCATPAVPTPDLRKYGAQVATTLSPQQITAIQQQRKLKRDQQWQRYHRINEQERLSSPSTMQSTSSPSPRHLSYSEVPSEVVHHEEVHEEIMDEQQPCSSNSMYH